MSKRTTFVKELRNMREADLQKRLQELRERQRELSFRTRGDEIRDVHQFKKTRHEIATILTILQEKRKIK